MGRAGREQPVLLWVPTRRQGAHRAPLWRVGYPRSRILPDVDSRQPTSWIQPGAEVLGQLKSDAQ